MSLVSLTAALFMTLVGARPAVQADECDGKKHDRNFSVTNGGEKTIRFIHLADADGEAGSSGKDWGPDILGKGVVLRAGLTTKVEIPESWKECDCKFDLAVQGTGADDPKRYIEDFDVCANSNVTFVLEADGFSYTVQ